ncbi:sulfate transport system permease protein [Alkalispirochaeta americana]|uniref:Sulfate transport system permease protein CysT n=1 Tax=Alkalispirochaeta americana TaxID=159291 RepID=A0A1N6T012_9SPIO|nr:sulfate ABC transporter permease subunit CysT [Alkalispirochaeta americana]SIQ46693.1 sulfate transport system permease protein [Alkalispirochaeta americana]
MVLKNVSSSPLPGFGLSLGISLTYLGLVVMIPLGGLVISAFQMSFRDFLAAAVQDPRVLASYRLSFGSALIAALINAFFGFIVAWVLVRYQFPGRRFLDALVDIPFALPTAVSGIALTTLYASTGWIGQFLAPLGIQIAYARPGIVLALIVVSLPFTVRTLQPALQELDMEVEEAALSLGASPAKTFFKVTLPTLMPAVLTGFSLALARGIGEFGSVYFIAGNLPMRTEIAPLLIVMKLEQYDYQGATAIGVVMLLVSFLLLLAVNMLQWLSRRSTL